MHIHLAVAYARFVWNLVEMHRAGVQLRAGNIEHGAEGAGSFTVAGQREGLCCTDRISCQQSGSRDEASKAHLFLVTHCQNRVGLPVDTVAGYMATVSEIDDPVPKFVVHVLNRSPHSRLSCQQLDAVADGLHSPLGGVRARFTFSLPVCF